MAGEGDAERLVVLLEARLNDFEKNMMKAAGISQRQFNAIRKESRSATRQMEADMDRATRRINQLLAGTSTKIGSYARSFAGGLAGGIFAGGLEGFVRGVRTVVSDLAKMQKQIERVGISAKAFQELRYGFQSAGVSSDAFVDGLDTFNRKIADAATKGGRLADILKANGVAIRDHNGQIRSAEALLRDYAELVKNAGSEQERMLLVQEAFGNGDFVNALKNGADGIDEMGRSAERTGVIIDEELLKKADELDTRWADAWERFEVNGKAAIMNVIGFFDQFAAKYAEFEKRRNAAILGAEVGAMAGQKQDPAALAGSLAGSLVGPENPLPSTAPVPSSRPQQARRTTVIPGKKTKTSAIKKTADDVFAEDVDRIRDRIAAMKEEQAVLGLSYFEQQKRTMSLELEQKALKDVREAARRKGDKDWQNVQLSETQRKTIDQVSEAYARQADELRKATQLQQLQQDVLRGVFDDMRSALESGKLSWRTFAEIAIHALDKVISKIEDDLIDAIMQANTAAGGGSLLGNLFGLLGGGSSSGGSIPWSEDIFRAGGGPVKAGQPYIVGEKRPELFVPDRSGTIVPRVPDLISPPMVTSSAGGDQHISVTFSPSIVMQGGGDNAGEQVTEALKKFEKEFTPRVVKSLREAKTRGLI